MKKNIFLLNIVLSICYCFGQKIEWEKSFGGIHAEYLMDAQPTADYGFILAGSSLSKKTGNKESDNVGDLDYFVWKMDEHGNLDWQKSFGGEGSDLLQCIALTDDGGFILAGVSASDKSGAKLEDSKGGDDFWIIKLNAKGGEEWQKTIGGLGQEKLNTITKTKDGGLLIGGTTASDQSGDKTTASFGNLDYWIIKLDFKGKIEWQQTFGGLYADELKSVEQTTDGGYILGGYSNSPSNNCKTEDNKGTGDFWIIKTDTKGSIEWQRTIGGDQDDHLYTLHQTKDKGYLVGGNSNSNSSYDKTKGNGKGTDIWILKLNDTGKTEWQETYDIANNDVLTSIVENKNGTYLLAGYAHGEYTTSPNNNKTAPKAKEDTDDYIAILINDKGEELWRKTVGSNGKDVLKKAIETRDGGYLLAGTSVPTNSSLSNPSKGGALKNSRDQNTAIGSNDYWVVKLKDYKKPDEEKKYIEAFPNPTTGFSNVIIGFEFEKATATLVDLNGRQLQKMEVTQKTVPFDLSSYPTGIYIVNIKTNDRNESVKIIRNEK